MAAKPGPSPEDLAYWEAIKPGDFVGLRDFQSISEAGPGGIDCRVRDVRRIEIRDRDSDRALATYHVHELERPGSGALYLAVVAASTDFELRLYFMPSSLEAGTRDRLIDLDRSWLFLPPPNPEDFISSELEYAPYPDLPPLPETGDGEKRVYAPAGFGQPVYGSYRRGSEEVPVIAVEYACEDAEAPNPLLLVLEERWMRPDGEVPPEGGLVSVLVGCRVDRGSVSLYGARG